MSKKNEASLSRRQLLRRRFFRNKSAVFGLVCLMIVVFLAVFGPSLSPWSWNLSDENGLDFNAFTESPYGGGLTAPSFDDGHYFGTSQVGADVFAQTMRGLQKSLLIGLLVAVFSTSIAAIVGASAGYLMGKTDRALMWLVDLLLVLPSFLLLAILSKWYQSSGWLLLVVLLAIFNWMITARIVRSVSMSLRERDFVRAARYMGVPTRKIITKHLIPNMASLLIIDGTLNVGGAILSETGLSYLGFGVRAPDVSLGSLIAEGTASAITFPWLFMFSGGLLIITVLAVSLIGDGLRDAFDPGSRSGKKS
jgi:peptide/nickel transport system permease protein